MIKYKPNKHRLIIGDNDLNAVRCALTKAEEMYSSELAAMAETSAQEPWIESNRAQIALIRRILAGSL